MYIEKLKVGDIELKNNVILAPMAGITDLSYRKICKKYGKPGLVCTEMVSSKGLYYNCAEDGIDGTKEGKHYNLNYRGQTEMGIFQFDKSARFSGVLQFRSIV